MLKGKSRTGDVAMSGCACGLSGEGRKAAGVDQELKEANRNRLRRIEGQVRGLQKMVEEEPLASLRREGTGQRKTETGGSDVRRIAGVNLFAFAVSWMEW